MTVRRRAIADGTLAILVSGKEPASPMAMSPAAAAGPAIRGWLRRLIPQEYLQRRWWKLGAGGGGGLSLLAELSRSLRWKRLSGFSISLRSGSVTALLDAVVFRVLYVVEAVVLSLALSCFFLCCGCHI